MRIFRNLKGQDRQTQSVICLKTIIQSFLILLALTSISFHKVADLRYASPATVSRCGMVYVDPKNLGYMPYWTKWCEARPNKNEQTELNRLFEKYVPPSIDLILEGVMDGKQGKKLKSIIPLTNLNMVRF